MADPVAIIITSRLNSSRIPHKPFAEIAGRRAMEWQLDFLRRSGYPITAALPAGAGDDPLAKAYSALGVDVLRGHDDSPLHRLAWAAEQVKADHVVRVTSDDLLLDPELLKEMVEQHIHSVAGYTYSPAGPQGGTAEVMSESSLRVAAKLRDGQAVEYVSSALKESGAKIHAYLPHPQYRHPFRLVLDWPEDLTVLRILFSHVARSYDGGFSLSDAIQFMRSSRNAYVAAINAQPQVTVYTSCFNQERYVRRAMESVAQQEGVRWEYLVYDDHSGDDTLNIGNTVPEEIMEWYSGLPEDKRRAVSIFRNENNLGLPATCNRAIARARGKYLIRLDADDEMLPGALAALVSTMRGLGDAAALFSRYETIDAEGRVMERETENTDEHPGMCLLLTRAANDVRYREGLQHYEGVEFMKRFKARYHVAHSQQVTWRYRKHGASKSAVQTPEREAVRRELAS